MCLTLGPRLLTLPGPNSLIASQSFQSKSSSPFPGSKAPTYILFTLWLLSYPLPSLSLLQTHWPPGCYLDLLSNFQPQGLCTSCSPFLKNIAFGWTCSLLPLEFCSNTILHKIATPVALVTSHMSYVLLFAVCLPLLVCMLHVHRDFVFSPLSQYLEPLS